MQKKSKYWKKKKKKPLKLSNEVLSNAYNQKWSFDIFRVIHLQNIFMEDDIY